MCLKVVVATVVLDYWSEGVVLHFEKLSTFGDKLLDLRRFKFRNCLLIQDCFYAKVVPENELFTQSQKK